MNATDLISALEDAGYEARSYSGRCMYGRCCVGVVVSESPLDLGVKLGVALLSMNEEFDPSDLPGASQDSMGRDVIVYWPSIIWPKEVNEEE